jgi:hypothetical protein
MKMENEQIMTLAAVRPRDQAKILRELKDQLEIYPSFAAAAIYSKPCGKDENGQMKIARGLSVRAAESIREAYGFNRVSTFCDPLDDDTVRIGATFVDYQKGSVWQSTGILSKTYKSRKGDIYRHPDDRFYNVVVQAALSRHVREVILRSVPAGLKSELFDAADRLSMAKLDPKVVEKTISAFATKQVTVAMLEEFIGVSRSNWSNEHRKTLLEIYTAIDEGETTVAEAFGLDARERRDQTASDVTYGTQVREAADTRAAAASAALGIQTPAPGVALMTDDQRRKLFALAASLGIKGSRDFPVGSGTETRTIIKSDDEINKALGLPEGDDVVMKGLTKGAAIILVDILEKREAKRQNDQTHADAGEALGQ